MRPPPGGYRDSVLRAVKKLRLASRSTTRRERIWGKHGENLGRNENFAQLRAASRLSKFCRATGDEILHRRPSDNRTQRRSEFAGRVV